jgi:general secretion pathway protein E/type IV pilus assembly protein PilB
VGVGTILLERGLINQEQLDRAIEEQNRTGERLDHVMVRLGVVSSAAVLEVIGHQFALPIVDLDSIDVDPEVLQLLPPKLVFKQRCVPIARSDGTLRIATCDPFELTAFDELRLLTGMAIELVLADERDIRKFIRTHYGVAGDTLDELAGETDPTPSDIPSAEADELEQAQEAGVIKLVNDLIVEAIRERATDVHLEPYEERLIIRYRIDGVLGAAGVPATVSRFRNAIISRVKIMANLNIAEKRRPQDGRITLRHKGAEYDLRVSVIPMLFGEGIVLRILNKSAAMFELESLGMEGDLLSGWESLITRPHGILLVTGPTGCGKSTTLYASLARIVTDEVKAITVEDPVEYHLEGVSQIQVMPQVDVTFATGLRAVLRHDPDLIMIGEIRDLETAEAAVQASLTGHLVFSTLHTNDASGALTRLMDMGVEPFLVATSLEGVLAQRLVRLNCPACRETYTPQPSEIPPGLELNGQQLTRSAGCRECRNTGFSGRVAIYELLAIREQTREQIMSRASARQIAQSALAAGDLAVLRDAGFAKVLAGQTTLAEVLRATQA